MGKSGALCPRDGVLVLYHFGLQDLGALRKQAGAGLVFRVRQVLVELNGTRAFSAGREAPLPISLSLWDVPLHSQRHGLGAREEEIVKRFQESKPHPSPSQGEGPGAVRGPASGKGGWPWPCTCSTQGGSLSRLPCGWYRTLLPYRFCG